MPDPSETQLKGTSETQLRSVVVKFRELWTQLSNNTWELSGGELKSDLGRPAGHGGFWTVLRMVGIYYGYSLFRYATLAGHGAAVEILKDSALEKPSDIDEEDLDSLVGGVQCLSAANMLLSLDACAWGLFLATMIDEMDFQPGELTDEYDSDFIGGQVIEEFHRHGSGVAGELRLLFDSLLSTALGYRSEVLKQRFQRRRDRIERSGAVIPSRELVLLGARHPLMAEKYGPKRVERVFEQQVALIFQSLGFTVVPVKPGAMGADFICISRERRFSFLADAKTASEVTACRSPISEP